MSDDRSDILQLRALLQTHTRKSDRYDILAFALVQAGKPLPASLSELAEPAEKSAKRVSVETYLTRALSVDAELARLAQVFLLRYAEVLHAVETTAAAVLSPDAAIDLAHLKLLHFELWSGMYTLQRDRVLAQLFPSKHIHSLRPVSTDEAQLHFVPKDELYIDLSHSLISLLEPEMGMDLMGAMARLRKTLLKETGSMLPRTRYKDDLSLPPHRYGLYFGQEAMFFGEILVGCLLVEPENGRALPYEVFSIDARVPGVPVGARWVAASQRAEVLALGFAVREPLDVMLAHVAEAFRAHFGFKTAEN